MHISVNTNLHACESLVSLNLRPYVTSPFQYPATNKAYRFEGQIVQTYEVPKQRRQNYMRQGISPN